jgi:hypothetical protein
MGSGTLDDEYLHWLYSQVEANVRMRRSTKTYWGLLHQMYTTPFVYSLPNDSNRAVDGLELRREWVLAINETVHADWITMDCSFLEMLIALARRAAFQTELSTSYWFWEFMKNLAFDQFVDTLGNPSTYKFVENRMGDVMHRLYDERNIGGLFPLRASEKDQRTVEIWYQLCEYLLQE